MKETSYSFFGQTRYWWLIMAIGLLMIAGGFCYWCWPMAGYAIASMLFGWLLILAGVVQVCVISGNNRPKGWGWWLAGGVIDMFIGFTMVRSLPFAESVFPYFMAFLFIYWGIEEFISASTTGRKYWWLGIINGILLCIVGFLFVESGLRAIEFMTSFLVSIAFIYWGFTLTMASMEMKPGEIKQ